MRRVQGSSVLAGLVALWAAAGCATAPKLVVPQTPLEIAHPAEVADAVPVGPSRCGDPIRGWRAFAKPGRVIVLGEKHGSNEIPRFLIDAACQAAEAGLAVHLSLEIAALEQHLVEEYLQSEGTAEDRAALYGAPMWHRMYEDGRSSRAIAEVIERARVLRKAGLSIDVHYYEAPIQPGSNKEKAMAMNLIDQWNASPRDLFLVLTGNTHARTVIGVDWDKDLEPMGYHLVRTLPDVVVLDAQYTGGEAWNCELSQWGRRPKCRARFAAPPLRTLRAEDLPASTDGRPVPRFAGTFAAPSEEGYHGVFFVGELTAAPPATQTSEFASR